MQLAILSVMQSQSGGLVTKYRVDFTANGGD